MSQLIKFPQRLTNRSGKVITLFIVIIAILLITLTAASIYYLHKETERRKSAEQTLEQLRVSEKKLQDDLKESQKQAFLLEEKNKEADEKINSLLDEVELEKGLREEMKLENASLKEQVDKNNSEKDEIRDKFKKDLAGFESKVSELEEKLKIETKRSDEFEQKYLELEEMLGKKEGSPNGYFAAVENNAAPLKSETAANVDLEEIVVNPQQLDQDGGMDSTLAHLENAVTSANVREGRILSVDKETEFVVVDLGEKDGIKKGAFMSVYRGDDYLGDIQITRVQPEMSAADIIPPFSSLSVRKNDQVILK